MMYLNIIKFFIIINIYIIYIYNNNKNLKKKLYLL